MVVQLPLTMDNLDSIIALGFEARRMIHSDINKELATIQVAIQSNNYRIACRRPGLPYISINEMHVIEFLEAQSEELALEYAAQFRSVIWEKQ